MIDAIDGGQYQAASVIPYMAGATYHFRMVVNVGAHTYSTYVTPAGGGELTVGANYGFRTGTNVASLSSWGVVMQSTAAGTITACAFSVQ